jgi:uncharacterized ferredoxin-like protein
LYLYEVSPVAIVLQYEVITLMTKLILFTVRTQPSIVKGLDETAVTYVNSETGFGRLQIVMSLDGLIYISDTDMQEGHR